MLAPYDEKLRLGLLHPCLPLWISFYVCTVVIEQITLNLRLSRSIEESILIRPEIRIVEFDIRVIAQMTSLGGLKGQQVLPKRIFVRGSIGPESSPRRPVRA